MPGSTKASSARPLAGAASTGATLRASGRAAILGLWTAALAGLAAALLVWSPREAARREVLHHWARGAARILGLRITVADPPPNGVFLLVANHLGYLDVITLAACVRAGFVAKREVRGWPVWGALAALVGTLFVDRARPRDAARVASQMAEQLAAGQSLIVFPEGTSTAGRAVLPFRSALLESAVASSVPVHYASLAYRTSPGDPPADTAVCWWGDMTFGPHLVGLLRLRGIEAHLRFGAEPVRAPNRKRLAEALHERVSALVEEVGEGGGRGRRNGRVSMVRTATAPLRYESGQAGRT